MNSISFRSITFLGARWLLQKSCLLFQPLPFYISKLNFSLQYALLTQTSEIVFAI